MKEVLELILGKNYSKLDSYIYNNKRMYNVRDLCNVLGLKNTSVTIRGNRAYIGFFPIGRGDFIKDGPHENSRLYVTEAGIYKVILKSRKPAAILIKNLLSEAILPRIMNGNDKKRDEE